LNYASVNTGDWAIVSWTTDSNGNLSTSNVKQTFLVQVAATPEPRMVGMLALAMAGLLFLGHRRLVSNN